MVIKFKEVSQKSDPKLLRELEQGACYTESIHIKDVLKYRKRWFQDEVGKKITIIAQDMMGEEALIVGVICLWKNPYDCSKWHIEELNVLPEKRNQGIREALIMHAVETVEANNEEVIGISMEEGYGTLIGAVNEVLGLDVLNTGYQESSYIHTM